MAPLPLHTRLHALHTHMRLHGLSLHNDTFYAQVPINVSEAMLGLTHGGPGGADQLARLHTLVLFGVSLTGLVVIAFLLFSIFYKNERIQQQCAGHDPDVEDDAPSKGLQGQDSSDEQPGLLMPPGVDPQRKAPLLGVLSTAGSTGKKSSGTPGITTEGLLELTVHGDEPDYVPYRGSRAISPSDIDTPSPQ